MRYATKRVSWKNLLLRSLAAGGMVSIAVLAPKMTRLLKEFDRPTKNRARLYARINHGLWRLQRAGLVEVTGTYGSRRAHLTAKGKAAMEQAEFESYQIPEPAFWDGKWRVLAFDMNERRRRTRDQLRRLLISAGFARIQDSVWVYPYPCDEFLSLARAHLKSGTGEMRMFVAEALESDRVLRERFNLSSSV